MQRTSPQHRVDRISIHIHAARKYNAAQRAHGGMALYALESVKSDADSPLELACSATAMIQ